MDGGTRDALNSKGLLCISQMQDWKNNSFVSSPCNCDPYFPCISQKQKTIPFVSSPCIFFEFDLYLLCILQKEENNPFVSSLCSLIDRFPITHVHSLLAMYLPGFPITAPFSSASFLEEHVCLYDFLATLF